MTFLKNLELTKADILVFDRLHGKKGTEGTKVGRHKIHKLIQMALNIFWRDFSDDKIKIIHSSCDNFVNVEFNSFMAALNHLVQNISKYVLPESEIKIEYKNDENILKIIISMISLYIYPDELKKIWEIGYSGILAKKAQKDGNGLGMHAIYELIKLNSGLFNFSAGEDTINVNGLIYSNNQAIIKIPISEK